MHGIGCPEYKNINVNISFGLTPHCRIGLVNWAEYKSSIKQKIVEW